MRPGFFEIETPICIKDTLSFCALGGIPLAGGQALLPDLRQRKISPSLLVDISSVPEINKDIIENKNSIFIGGNVSISQLQKNSVVAKKLPWIIQAADRLGDVQIRNLATVGGNICWSDPRANLAVAIQASGGIVHGVDKDGKLLTMEMRNFFCGFRENRLNGAILTKLEIPLRPNSLGYYSEFSRQRQDLALASVAGIKIGGNLNLSIGGIGITPVFYSIKLPIKIESIIELIGDSAIEELRDQFASKGAKMSIIKNLLSKAPFHHTDLV